MTTVLRLIFPLLLPLVLLAQTGTPTRTTWTTAPQNAVAFETAAVSLPASAVQICSAGTVTVTRTSGTVLSLGNGAAATTPQYARLTPRSRSITAAVTLTISSGSASGTVEVYGFIKPDRTFEFRALNNTTNVLALSAGTVVGAGSAQSAETRALGTLLYSWNITSGSWDVSGTNKQTASDCWVDYLELANKTASAVTITATDGLGTPVAMFTSASLPANTTWTIVVPGGRFFEQGLKVTVGTAQAVDLYARGGKR